MTSSKLINQNTEDLVLRIWKLQVISCITEGTVLKWLLRFYIFLLPNFKTLVGSICYTEFHINSTSYHELVVNETYNVKISLYVYTIVTKYVHIYHI